MNVSIPVTLTGKVLHGKALGRTIDMPTANIIPKEDISGLAYGVYYSRVTVEGSSYKAITNIGRKPTVKDSDEVNVESFLYDFDGELYEKEISVELLEFRRPEKKFSSFEELTKEMHKDLQAGKEY